MESLSFEFVFFLASVYSCDELVAQLLPEGLALLDADVQEALDCWTSMVAPVSCPPEVVRGRQATWETPLHDLTFQRLLTPTTPLEDSARLRAAASPESGVWLSVLPSPQLGTHLSGEAFRISA